MSKPEKLCLVIVSFLIILNQWLILPAKGNQPDGKKSKQESEFVAVTELPRPGIGFIDKHGQVLSCPHVDDVHSFSEGLAAVYKNKRWGFINENGYLAIEPKYVLVGEFREGLAPVYNESRDWGYVDRRGNGVIKPQFDSVKSFSQGLAAVFIDGKWGYINKSGEVCITPKFDDADSFSNDRAVIAINNLYGYINKTGDLVIPAIYQCADDFSEDLAFVTDKDNAVCCIDKSGKKAFSNTFARVYHLSKSSEREGLFTRKTIDGKIRTIVMKYTEHHTGVCGFNSGAAIVQTNQRNYALIDRAGKEIGADRFEWTSATSGGDGLFAVLGMGAKNRGHWRIIDSHGRTVVQTIYNGIGGRFSEGTLVVRNGLNSGLMDKTGKLVVPMKYDEVGELRDGFVCVHNLSSADLHLSP